MARSALISGQKNVSIAWWNAGARALLSQNLIPVVMGIILSGNVLLGT